MKVGIIGYGRFGALLDKVFKERTDFDLMIYSRSQKVDNHQFFSFEDVCSADIIIPTVPISLFEDHIKEIAKYISDDRLVMDVCSVKVHPNQVMLKFLPDNIDILATHPMFGPDSTKNGSEFHNLSFIFHKTRIKHQKKVEVILNFFSDLGLKMIELSPEDHDKQAAYTHAYAFMIGKIGIRMNIKKNNISTKGFEYLLYNQHAVENDQSTLFNDIMTFNPYTQEMRIKMENALKEINSELKQV